MKYDIMSNVLVVEGLRLGDKAFDLLSYIFANVMCYMTIFNMCFQDHILCGTFIAILLILIFMHNLFLCFCNVCKHSEMVADFLPEGEEK